MKARALIAATALALLIFPVVSDSLYYQNMIILSLVFATGAVGLNIISGYGGYISLGQGASSGSAPTRWRSSPRASPTSRSGGGSHWPAWWRACSPRCWA
jgi:hypothetical protein